MGVDLGLYRYFCNENRTPLQAIREGNMEQTKARKNHQSSNQSQSLSSCCVEAAATTKKNAVRDFYYQEIRQLMERDFTPAPDVPCLSPLLWSESFGRRLAG